MPILSFSVPEMLPSVAWGVLAQGDIYQPDGADAFWERIVDQAALPEGADTLNWMNRTGRINKTQTIRPFDYENPNPRSWHSRIKPGDYCDIWWKQRAPKLAFKMGRVKLIGVHSINIRRYSSGEPRVELWSSRTSGQSYLPFTAAHHSRLIAGQRLEDLAAADGFTSVEAFIDYFAPKLDDEFRGNMLVW